MIPSAGKITRICACLLAVSLSGCGTVGREDFPKVLARAWSEFQARDYDLALSDFDKVAQGVPASSAIRVEALYGEASCWNLRREDRDPDRARALLKQVQDLAPVGPLAAWAALDTVRTHQLVTGDEKADDHQLIADYGNVITRYPDSPAATEAFLYQCNLKFLMATTHGQFRELEKALTDFAQKNPSSPYLGSVYGALQGIYDQLGEPENELKMALLVLATTEKDPTDPGFNLSGNYWNIAHVAQFQLGDFATARKYYNLFIAENPYDPRVFTARRMLKEMDRIDREGTGT